MIIKRVVEELNEIFPHLGETQIVQDLDIAQKDFIAETNYLEGYALLSNPSTNCAWALPSDFNKFKEILLYDISGNPLYLEDYSIKYEIEFDNIYFYSISSTPITVLPLAIAYIYLGYYKRAITLSDPSNSFEVEDEHLAGIYAKMYKEYYAKYPIPVITPNGSVIKTLNLNASNFWATEEIKCRIKTKRWLNNKNDSSDGTAIYQEAGMWLLPKRIKSLIGLTSPISGTATSNVKEANFIITPSGITQVGDIVGFTSMTATLDLPNNQVTFTGNISLYTDFESNNKGWDKVSEIVGTSVIIEWSDGITGIIVATIFEKVIH